MNRGDRGRKINKLKRHGKESVCRCQKSTQIEISDGPVSVSTAENRPFTF